MRAGEKGIVPRGLTSDAWTSWFEGPARPRNGSRLSGSGFRAEPRGMRPRIRQLFTALVLSSLLMLAACAGTAPEVTDTVETGESEIDTDDGNEEAAEAAETEVQGDEVTAESAESHKPRSVETVADESLISIDLTAAAALTDTEAGESELEKKAVAKEAETGKKINKEIITKETPTQEVEIQEVLTLETVTPEVEIQETTTQKTVTPEVEILPNPLLSEDRPYVEIVASDPIEPGRAADTTTAESEEQALNDPAVSAATPSRLLEGPGEFTITLEGLGWIFRSDRSTPGSWRFLERELDGNSTHFRFMFTETGNWNLVFERQDLSSGASENVVRTVMVSEDDGSPRIDNGPVPETSENPIPGIMPMDAETRNDAALIAADEGRFGEAIEYWEQDASRNDEAGRRARASLVENAARSGSIGPLITWLPKYMEDGPDPEILAAALEVFDEQAGYDGQSYLILEELIVSDFGTRRPEWLYRLAFYLEKPGEDRDLDRSAELYQEVINGWPITVWRDLSLERLLWLQRHYFRVR